MTWRRVVICGVVVVVVLCFLHFLFWPVHPMWEEIEDVKEKELECLETGRQMCAIALKYGEKWKLVIAHGEFNWHCYVRDEKGVLHDTRRDGVLATGMFQFDFARGMKVVQSFPKVNIFVDGKIHIAFECPDRQVPVYEITWGEEKVEILRESM